MKKLINIVVIVLSLVVLFGERTSFAESVTVSVTPNCTINDYTANPIQITSGNSATLIWSTTNCANVTISNLGYNVSTSGHQVIWPTETKIYTLTAYSQNGTPRSQSLTVYVNDPPASHCAIDSFNASSTSISKGESTVLRWNTSDCTSISIPMLDRYNVSMDGSQVVWPNTTTTYTLIALSSSQASVRRSITIYVDDTDECEIQNFSASDTSIDSGDSTTLRWNTYNCDQIIVSTIGNVSADGSRTIYPSVNTTYTLTAYSSEGSRETETVRIYVDDNSDCSIDDFTTTNTSIVPGNSVTLRWDTTNCNNVNISNIGDVAVDGSRTIYPTTTTTYILRAYGNNNDSQSIKINVESNQVIIPPVYNIGVVTTIASNISQTGAQLNGLITNSNQNNLNTSFEYGETVSNLVTKTYSRLTTGNTNFSETITNLKPNTIYYFRAVAEGPEGVFRGSIEVFRTLGNINNISNNNNNKPVKPVISQGPTVTNAESPVILKIQNEYQTIKIGDIINYVVHYKNISTSILSRPMVQVYIPKGITFLNASRGTYNEEDATLSATIEDLNPNAEGYIYIQARVDSLDSKLAQVVTTAVLIYTKPNEAQENAMAYVLNIPVASNTNLLGAAAFLGGIFEGLSLICWLMLIIIILLLVLMSRMFYSRRKTIANSVNHQ